MPAQATHLRDRFRPLLSAALAARGSFLRAASTDAFRVFGGRSDGLDGLFLDVYGPGAALLIYEQILQLDDIGTAALAAEALDALAPLGVRGVYAKPFAKDRSRLGGALPPSVTLSTPAAGEPLDEALIIREHHWRLEARLYDGLSTGLFMDQRENRRFVNQRCEERRRRAPGVPTRVLNTFAYTGAFSVAAAAAGAETTTVDVSGRYLDWARRNFAHNSLPTQPPSVHRFVRMDTFEFFAYARRKQLQFDLIVLDPPSFAAGSKKKGIRPWSSITDYPRLVGEATTILAPGGLIFASTNTAELCRDGRLDRQIEKALARRPRWVDLPPPPPDFARETGRFAARAFTIAR